jgi:hypothetical protein
VPQEQEAPAPVPLADLPPPPVPGAPAAAGAGAQPAAPAVGGPVHDVAPRRAPHVRGLLRGARRAAGPPRRRGRARRLHGRGAPARAAGDPRGPGPRVLAPAAPGRGRARRRRRRGPPAARVRRAPPRPRRRPRAGPRLRLRRLRRVPVRALPRLRRLAQGVRGGRGASPPLPGVQRERLGTLPQLLFLIACLSCWLQCIRELKDCLIRGSGDRKRAFLVFFGCCILWTQLGGWVLGMPSVF